MTGFAPFADPPLSLYVHIPWCVRKCPYCDFNSHRLEGELPEAQYIQALLRDLEYELQAIENRSIETIFIGGGTPSLFTPESIGRLLAGVASQIEITANAEITLEANPGTIESGRFREFVAAGVNRISIGVQSFNDTALQRIGRIHDGHKAVQAVEIALSSGTRSINLDLMFALPEQTLEGSQQDLRTAIELGPEHISWYQLTLEPNTQFYHNPPPLPNADLAWDIQQCGQQLLGEAGYERYEISAYAKPAERSQHNLNYWRFGDYLGIGAGAHGKISTGRSGRINRVIKRPHPRQYLAAMQTAQDRGQLQRTVVGAEDRRFEFMLNALRLLDGFEPDLFQARTGLDLTTIAGELDRAMTDGLIEVNRERIQATEFGLRFLNDLVARFLITAGDT